ncbi:amidohydrolase family protein [Thermoplasma sp.]|uniref:amidohydrolase family protein n=1 Tax=Thermoplasma sp. TaxID=1973142 RepID=UPI0012772CDB|nr:amidohydrolase family protein [Thermoplasma sp.]KAA8922991.1 MAG: amidohydrolase family protein [Thermoplasma sp.]
MSTLIENALIVTQDQTRRIFRGNVQFDGDTITYVGREKPKSESIIDGTGKIVIPGFINTHAHVGMSASKGLFDDVDLERFLDMTFKYDAQRTEDGIFNSARIGMYEMINAGITSFVDLYYSEDVIARAAEQVGIRAFLSWVTLDREFTTQKGDPLDNAENFIRSHRNMRFVRPSVGVQGIYVASDETYHRAKEIADRYDTILHMHLSETRKEVYDSVKKIGERPIEHLDRIGVLSDRVIAAHCVWSTYHEAKILGKDNVNVSWNSVSNFKLATGGVPPIPEMFEAGANITLGTDSNGSNNSLNFFEVMKFSALTLKNARWDASAIKSQQILDFATINAANALKINAGSIEVGKKADIVILDARAPELIPTSEINVVNNIVYSAGPGIVDSVIIDGIFRKKDGKLIGFDQSGLSSAENFI